MNQQTRGFSRLIIGVAFVIALVAGRAVTEVGPVLAQTTNVTVTINAPDMVAPGSNFTANVTISQVQNFDACNYNVSFDSTVLKLDKVTAGQIGSTIIPVSAWNQTSPGQYTILQNIPGLSGVIGSGILAVLHFRVVGSGEQASQINLSDGTLVNIEAQAIPAMWTGDSVQVTEEPVPTVAKESGNPALTIPLEQPVQPQTNWPVLWGVIGGVVVVILLVIFQARKRRIR